MSPSRALFMGARVGLDGASDVRALHLPTDHLTTHAVVVGMTGSGKTGLVTVLIEEALLATVPVLVIDVKGDLPNLLLAFPTFDPSAIAPWADGPPDALANQRKEGLAYWRIGEPGLADYAARSHFRVLTPGSDAGELVHVLSALERRSSRWDASPGTLSASSGTDTGDGSDLEGARAALSAGVSLLLRLLGRESDPAKSREHVLLSVLAERRLLAGDTADIAALIPEIVAPPIDRIGALQVDAFLSKRARKDLAAAMNILLAAPTLATWRSGTTLDIGAWMQPVDGKTPATILSVAHLDDEERALVLGVVLEETLSWVRTLPGSQRLRALIVFDEVYGFLPPHPASPPTKRPIVSLMKQARAFGVGVVIATQNPMDLDYRALSNAGLWCLGRLQTDADRDRVIDGLAGANGSGEDPADLEHVLKRLAPRWFLMRDAHAKEGSVLMQPRHAMSFMRGPMTRVEIRKARRASAPLVGADVVGPKSRRAGSGAGR